MSVTDAVSDKDGLIGVTREAVMRAVRVVVVLNEKDALEPFLAKEPAEVDQLGERFVMSWPHWSLMTAFRFNGVLIGMLWLWGCTESVVAVWTTVTSTTPDNTEN